MNKRLMAMVALNHKISAYIPATVDVNVNIDNTPYVEKMAAIMSEAFGGATSTPANGFWLSSTTGLVKESTTIVFAFASDLNGLDNVIDYLVDLKVELNQEAMALEVDGSMYFI